MPTTRGFAHKIEIGRAGLVSVLLIHTDGSSGTYVIEDLDADPERFNERLSKLAILRDAMNRAEPVEIEHTSGEAGQTIERVARISRDALAPPTRIETHTGLVVDALLHSENNATSTGEKHDFARVVLLTSTLGIVQLTLDMQGPERLVKSDQFDMIRRAQSDHRLIRVLVDVGGGGDDDIDRVSAQEIIAVAVLDDFGGFGDDHDDRVEDVHGFVETLSLIRLGTSVSAANVFAHVQFTTSPPFTGPGNTIGLAPFTPERLDLLVPRSTPDYDLFEAGLRDNLRMRVRVLMLSGREPDDERGDDVNVAGERETPSEDVSDVEMRRHAPPLGRGSVLQENARLVLGAELLAHLASASRPVWITISRSSLDQGPDGHACTPGVPSSDLTPRSLRDLRIPYPAVWKGIGCFNKGVYRFQLQLPSPFRLLVDGEELCLHDAEEGTDDEANGEQPGIKMAYACLGGEHTVEVVIDEWICDYDFIFDVYQIR